MVSSSSQKNGRLISPLRYPGSKRRLAIYIRQALLLNDVFPDLYVEPFAGGASVALQLLSDHAIGKAILIDRDPYVAHFWEAVFFDTDWLVHQIETIEVTIEKWHEFKGSSPQCPRDFALSCLFLNRTSFSGLLTDEVGPIGGKTQSSEYPIDCRFPRDTLIRRIRKAAEFRDRVYGIWDCSWNDGIERIRQKQKEGELPSESVFFYLDPPFFEKANRLYRFYFTEDDHQELRDFLLNLRDHWILSYDSAEQVETLYGAAIQNKINGTRRRNIELLYSTSITPGSQPGREVVLSNLRKLPSKTRMWKSNDERTK